MSHRNGFVGVAALFVFAHAAAAQTAPALSKGARVRVVIPAADDLAQRYVTGPLVRLMGDTVVIWTGGLGSPETQTLTLEAGRRLEALVTTRGHGGQGAAIGGVVGALMGAAIGAASWHPCTQGFGCLLYPSQGAYAAAGAVVGAGGGALLGLVIGSTIRTEIWGPLETKGIRLAIAPGAVGVRVAF